MCPANSSVQFRKIGANVEFWRLDDLDAVSINLSPISSPETRPEPRAVMMNFAPGLVCNRLRVISSR